MRNQAGNQVALTHFFVALPSNVVPVSLVVISKGN